MEKPKGDKTFGERMKKLREEKKKMKEDQKNEKEIDLEKTVKKEKSKLSKKKADETPQVDDKDISNDEQIKVLNQAILDLSLDVEYLIAQM